MLHKESIFKIKEENRLGTMRIDWYDGALNNQWNPTDLLIKLVESKDIDLATLQKELNYLQFELLGSFENAL